MRGPVERLSSICRTRSELLSERGHARRVRRISGRPRSARPPSWASSRATAGSTSWAGCCGTTPEWIAAIGRAIEGVRPRAIPDVPHWSTYSGMEPLVIRPETNFVMIGERTNITGSKKFARLIKSGDFEAALAVARDQVEGGANILDVNMDEGMIDGEAAMTRFLNLVSADPAIAKIPIMVDSSKWTVIEAGLKCVQGKSVVNSISLKGGEEEFLRQARLVRRYGAAVVVMAFDEEGQAVTVDRKVAICRRAFDLLTEKAGFPGRGHHLRRQYPHRGHRHRGTQQLRRRIHRGRARAEASPARLQDLRRREQRVVLVSRQRRGARGDERGLPVSRDSPPGWTWESSTPASSWSTTRSPRTCSSVWKTCS